MDPVTAAVIAGVSGVIVGMIVWAGFNRLRGQSTTREVKRLLDHARREVERLHLDAEIAIKDELFKKREAFEAEARETREELKERDRRLAKKEDALDHKDELLVKRDRYLEEKETRLIDRERGIDKKLDELSTTIAEQKRKLAEISGLSADEARQIVLDRIKEELAQEETHLTHRMLDRLKETADEKARWAISQAIHRVASEHTTENTTATIDLPSDDMKGRIIGRDGRNIRAFEKSTGVDVIVDDTPGIVVVSTFDSVRREIARRSMEKLIADGRIHPARIEEIVTATELEIEKSIVERGKQVQFETDVTNIHPKIQYLLGRLLYRTSYGQNVLLHSIEVAHIMGILAAELNLDVKLAKRCGLLHDIGKALDHDQEGGHPAIGAEFAKKYGEAPEVIDAIAFHHDISQSTNIWPILTSAGDAISASRPGARRESFERYIKRLERLEEVATRFDGVSHAYAIQAGREIRVIVDEHQISDEKALTVARKIARDIEEELTYPGEIRVTLIRETRVTEFAR